MSLELHCLDGRYYTRRTVAQTETILGAHDDLVRALQDVAANPDISSETLARLAARALDKHGLAAAYVKPSAASAVRCPDHRNGGATSCPRGGAALQIWQRKQWGE
jgi:hypothetical protein